MQDNKESLTLVKNDSHRYYVDSQGRTQGKSIGFAGTAFKLFEYNYVDNLKDGECIIYWYGINIIQFKFNYSKGLLEGETIVYYESGKIKYKGNYVNNNKEGLWIQYNDDNENTEKEFKYYENGIEYEVPSIQVKNARKKI